MGTVATISISGNDYNVYALTSDVLDDAKEYFNGHASGDAVWDAASTNTKKQALISAFRSFERKRWSGTKLVPGQATQWPRTGATCYSEIVADGTPDEIAFGEFELALAIIQDPTVLDKKNTRTDVKGVKAGTAAVEFFQPPPGEETIYPTVVQEWVGCFLSGTATDAAVGLASGTDVESQFSETDFERDEGFA